MADEKLKRIIDEATSAARERRRVTEGDVARKQAEMIQAGQTLQKRVMPRLSAARQAWDRDAVLDIKDDTDKFDLSDMKREFPGITLTLAPRGIDRRRTYRIETYPTGDLHIFKVDPNKENLAGKLGVKNIRDFTDEKIDELLKLLVNDAFNL